MRRTSLILISLILFSGNAFAAQKKSATKLPALEPLSAPKPTRARRSSGARSSSPLESRFHLTPSLTWIHGKEPKASRGMIKAQGNFKIGDWRFYSEGFVETDAAVSAKERRSKRTSELQEAYLEWKPGALLIRAGRQPLRWSDSWTTPSLDLWTARRFNRLFYDPLPEQLVHPTGVLASWGTPSGSLEVFQNLQPAENILPEPLPETPRTWRKELGARGKLRTDAGFDLAALYFGQRDKDTYGATVSYALDSSVPKLEVGRDSDQDSFITLAADFFFGSFSILSQVTRYSTALETPFNYYLLVRWEENPDSIDLQAFYDGQSRGLFYSFQYAHTFQPAVQLSFFMQYYRGDPSTLFGLYQTMTDGPVGGARIAITL